MAEAHHHDENSPYHHSHNTLDGTSRVEAFSDGVMAIAITLLILEIKVPSLDVMTSSGAWAAIVPVIPKLIGFALSFLTISIFWVNHHHFMHPMKKTNAALLWYNNHLLFWIAVIPFATAFFGDYPGIPAVVAMYGFVLFMAALAFNLMSRYAFFHCSLLPEEVSLETRKHSFRRSIVGVVLYAASIPLAFAHPYISFGIFIIVPLYYFLPRGIQIAGM